MESDSMDEDIDGLILSVHVKNFFCHDNLEINFNKNVNFIIGRNGSGKSAILSALVVGLGGRASATNRGNNLHSFIKKGTNSATVEIKIKNSSPKAFKHDIYGDSITIVRTINASGGSSYKVKSATGDIISTKFEEVNSIILAHDIQVDNPISVLNQDDARSFHASDAKKKYSLFRKATNLDQTENNYVKALENCNKAIAIWNRKNEASKELEKEYKKWKTMHDQMQSRDEIEAQKQALQNEYYWSEITEFEKEAASIQAQCEKQSAKCQKLADRLRTMEESYGSYNSTIESLKQRLLEGTNEKRSLEQELQEIENESRSVKESYRTAQHTASKHEDLLKREKRKVMDLEREINNIQSGGVESQREALERAESAARAKAEAARARYDTAQHEAEQARANATHAAAPADAAASAASHQRDKLKQLKQQLRELESRGNDSLAVFGERMVELCERVKGAVKRKEFSQPPRGPIGQYLKVKEKKWGGALEHILGGSIQNFCVNTPEDSRKLFEIMGQVYGSGAKPGVTCSKFLAKRHDVRASSVRAPPHRSALDALNVTDHVVANYLIDNLSLENILLVADHDEAVRLSDSVENVPQHCNKVVTLDGSEYLPAPHYRSYGGAARPARYLATSTADRKRQVLSEIEEGESKLQTLEAQAVELRNEAERARTQERQCARALQALLQARHAADEALRAAAAARADHDAPHHAVLVDELNVSKDKVRTLTEQVNAFNEQENEYKSKIEEYDARTSKLKAKYAQVVATCRSLNEEIEQEKMKMDQGVTDRQTYQQRLAEDKRKLDAVQEILQSKQSHVQKKIQEALLLCPRVDNPREKSVVIGLLKKTELKLNSLSNTRMTRAQVAEKLLTVERNYRRTELTLKKLSALIDEIKRTTDKHLSFCQRVQTYVARRVQHCFQAILTIRGYTGRMDIDQARGVLELCCGGRAGAAGGRGTSALSGGERSYATVAFMMALWDAVELPFYFMDEFDVFMDNVNRKIVLQLLIDHALKNRARQFVFLTPQDASALTASRQLSIHLMADPRP
ncbi:structural maintenance of chromosomes protein 6 [Aricia agestis]|uniref:structural maintenance of chromosomes protein 6 n=1 Tax=Aricia agestis TaxID=91739 RepID=UPI001C20774D|nr:structural maintenance of chromosomes protein 6 [Aricia agestis]